MRFLVTTALLALLVGLALTAATYAVESGCSCGPARGLPFTYVHPFCDCYSNRFVVPASPAEKLGPVFDVESLGYDVAIWSLVAFVVIWRFRRLAQHRAGRDAGSLPQH